MTNFSSSAWKWALMSELCLLAETTTDKEDVSVKTNDVDHDDNEDEDMEVGLPRWMLASPKQIDETLRQKVAEWRMDLEKMQQNGDLVKRVTPFSFECTLYLRMLMNAVRANYDLVKHISKVLKGPVRMSWIGDPNRLFSDALFCGIQGCIFAANGFSFVVTVFDVRRSKTSVSRISLNEDLINHLASVPHQLWKQLTDDVLHVKTMYEFMGVRGGSTQPSQRRQDFIFLHQLMLPRVQIMIQTIHRLIQVVVGLNPITIGALERIGNICECLTEIEDEILTCQKSCRELELRL